MSRTWRNRRERPFDWILTNYEKYEEGKPGFHRWPMYTSHNCEYAYYIKSEKDQRKAIAKFYADGSREMVGSGPRWFRNMFSERPFRRKMKKELFKYMKNPEYEPLCDAKNPAVIYWW